MVRKAQNWFVIFSVIGLFFSCAEKTQEQASEQSGLNAWFIDAKTIQGTTQGTTCVIKTSEEKLNCTPKEISDLLYEFDMELSGYEPNSILSQFNDVDSVFDLPDNRFFIPCYLLSQEIFKATNGAFDPSVFPLVEAWGFFKDMHNPPTKKEIDSLLQFVGFEAGKHHVFDTNRLIKFHPHFQLDFNAIAQGQSVDEIAKFLNDKGHENYFIEVGGEIVTKGMNDDQQPWIVGIDEPSDGNDGRTNRSLENYISISGKGVATSGNYRKFYESNGRKYSHTLNPKTGEPVNHNLLSATVIAENAAIADGFATAFMTMGVDSTLAFVANNPQHDLEVYLLFENSSNRIERAFSPGIQEYLLK
jgi:thiamine biosynthesis lipoprotein